MVTPDDLDPHGWIHAAETVTRFFRRLIWPALFLIIVAAIILTPTT
jgi:hypothetical protein